MAGGRHEIPNCPDRQGILTGGFRILSHKNNGYYRALQMVCYPMLHAIAYGPLIKSGRRPSIRTAECCEGFPVYR